MRPIRVDDSRSTSSAQALGQSCGQADFQYSLPIALLLVPERIGHQDGVFALGAGREQRDRAADQLLDAAHVLDAGCRQLAIGARALGALLPAVEGLPYRLELGLGTHG